MKFFKLGILLFLIITSCSSEKSLSPMRLSSINNESIPTNVLVAFQDKTGQIFYASELSSQISTFPKFQNSALNNEVANLKIYIKDYLDAVKDYDIIKQEQALHNYEKSYRKIQNLRKYLNKQDDEIINVYMVRIKNHIEKLNSVKSDSLK